MQFSFSIIIATVSVILTSSIFLYIYSKLKFEDKYGDISYKNFMRIFFMLGVYIITTLIAALLSENGGLAELKTSLIAASSPILAFTLVAIQDFYNDIQVKKNERFLRDLQEQNSQMSNEFSELHEKLINEIKSLKEDIKKLH